MKVKFERRLKSKKNIKGSKLQYIYLQRGRSIFIQKNDKSIFADKL